MDENKNEGAGMGIVEKVLGEEPKAEMNWLERLTGIFFSPLRTFADIARKHDWGLVPMLILILVGLAGNGVFLATHDVGEMAMVQMEESGKMDEIPDEQLDTIMKVTKVTTKISMIVGAVVAPPLFAAIIAFLFLIIFKMFGADSTFGQTFTVVVYSWFIYIIKSFLFLILIMFKKVRTFDEMAYFVKSNVAAFVDPESVSKPLMALLSSIDLFTIWVIILMAIGLSAITKKSPYLTGAVVFSLWLVAVVAKVGLAFLQTMGS